MATFHIEKSVIANGSLGTVKAMKRYWNQPVSDMDDNSNASKYTLLQMALMLQKKKVVEYLLPQQDLDLNTKATDGTTALMTACDQQARMNSSMSVALRRVPEWPHVAWQTSCVLPHFCPNLAVRCASGPVRLVYDLLVKYGATPRPEKPPTPPPEPEPATSPEKPEGTNETGTKSTTPEIVLMNDDAPGLDQHPGFWRTMCGCGGRSHKTEEVPALQE
ncbi:ankyrin repeat-containing protein, putative [Eimeria mitis]|uniref:Ankyrin repeat-containing protein, putative n=1 Tax=Eimeria mitis TaxID=44415 RepID=U6KGQ4_9EIME|nr:ankyrin repeat-containing protein, putative [Eimeria mitis]CDJ35956.1 ankyrin repeat-containing protein, putative [Eimeria mitis]